MKQRTSQKKKDLSKHGRRLRADRERRGGGGVGLLLLALLQGRGERVVVVAELLLDLRR